MCHNVLGKIFIIYFFDMICDLFNISENFLPILRVISVKIAGIVQETMDTGLVWDLKMGTGSGWMEGIWPTGKRHLESKIILNIFENSE